MPAPDIAVFVRQIGATGNDPEIVWAFDAAMSWARKALGVPADDTLAALDVDNHAAVYGYARDLHAAPNARRAMFDPDNVAAVADVTTIGRRWAPALTFGRTRRSSFA